ncbi:MAG: type I restriction enzyme HsdR N-terminal domain-containing protein [Bacteroidales bacterium]|jgi:hypothetical protein|nr:type I restriction enzyme HsdR N-terminal domain-containing protein [Bacteroidales bacterium]
MLIKEQYGIKYGFDPVRRCYVKLTPEEVVRQAYLEHLIQNLNIPLIAISVEKKILYNRRTRRYDIVVYKKGVCWLVVECKAETVELTEDVLQQAALYNSVLNAEYIVLFNGITEIILHHHNGKYKRVEKMEGFG